MGRTAHIPTSEVLQELLNRAPANYFTLDWLLGSLRRRSYGIILLLLALMAMIPGIATIVSFLLATVALQMILGRLRPVFPNRIVTRALPIRHFAQVVRWAIPVLRHLERAIRPRWHTPFEATRFAIGVVVLLLSALILAPVPLTHIIPALVIALIAVAYLEEDGVFLSISLLTALALLAAAADLVWEAAVGADWIAQDL